MKEFDLEKAKAGEPVITRDGRDVRIVCFDRKTRFTPIIGLLDNENIEDILVFEADGKYRRNIRESNFDLFMKPIKKTYHYCIYKLNDDSCVCTTSPLFSSEEEVRYFLSRGTTAIEYRTINIEA